MRGETGAARIGYVLNLCAAVMLSFGVVIAGAPDAASQGQTGAPQVAFGSDHITSPEGLPDIGKWMVDQDGTVAHWLGASYRGKHIREPINVILVDHDSTSLDQAKERLIAAAAAAGYPSREGHSGGYRGYIGGEFYGQLPDQPNHAFSNRPFVFNNNHGRIFGPAPFGDSYVFIGAFSRERVDPIAEPGHQYASFDQARDDFSQRLDASSGYSIVGFIDLGNAIVADPQVTTGDHDGRAVHLRAVE